MPPLSPPASYSSPILSSCSPAHRSCTPSSVAATPDGTDSPRGTSAPTSTRLSCRSSRSAGTRRASTRMSTMCTCIARRDSSLAPSSCRPCSSSGSAASGLSCRIAHTAPNTLHSNTPRQSPPSSHCACHTSSHTASCLSPPIRPCTPCSASSSCQPPSHSGSSCSPSGCPGCLHRDPPPTRLST